MREKLEEIELSRADGVADAVRQRDLEVAELKATVVALREAMERQAAEHRDNLHKAALASRDEIRQLREMIQALRMELEKTVSR